MANSFPGSGLAYADCFSVGTASPSQIFEVKSPSIDGGLKKYVFKGYDSTGNQNGIALRVFDTQGGVGFADVGADYFGGVGSNTTLTFSTRNEGSALTEGMRITNDGRIGIGSCDFTRGGFNAKMLIKQTSNGDWTGLQISDAADENVINFGYNGTDFLISQSWRQCGGPTKNLKIGLGCQIFLRNDGNVGIGTASPTAKLHVNGSSQFDDSLNFASRGKLSWGGSPARLILTSCGSYNLALGTDDFVDRMTIQCGTGNVGIGTTTPASKFHVACGQIRIEGQPSDDITGCSGYYLANAVNNEAYQWQMTCNFSLSLWTYSATCALGWGQRGPVFRNDGKTGIGTNNPGSYKLYVNGSFYSAGSSCEYKTSICQYNTDSCMFMKLKPVTYQYKDEWCHLGKELKSGTQIGLIAEDTAEVFPELAILKDEDEQKVVRNVDYEKLSIILLSEVQKLRKEVDNLKNNK